MGGIAAAFAASAEAGDADRESPRVAVASRAAPRRRGLRIFSVSFGGRSGGPVDAPRELALLGRTPQPKRKHSLHIDRK
ncbi:hypothetical protein Nans01_09010 [Nocardiopsis ansamitocini]|uniref:Uncharacterized protein n=1 Tax=Nocardiopsis ansamitocini TaxID=1670832 RepID=A0A9W6UI05_9ACTN|nr:hypothetical protein Nans01_09010 [Nocardiopsis ansamitocini]